MSKWLRWSLCMMALLLASGLLLHKELRYLFSGVMSAPVATVARPIFWEARAPDGKVVWLLGTQHRADRRNHLFMARVIQPYLLKADAVYTEHDIFGSEAAALDALLLQHGDGSAARVGDAQARLYAELAARGIPGNVAATLSVQQALALLVLDGKEQDRLAKSLDQMIAEQALLLGKPYAGLETAQQKLQAVLLLNQAESLALIGELLERAEQELQYELQMREQYYQRQLSSAEDYSLVLKALTPERLRQVDRAFGYERDVIFSKGIDQAPGRALFVAVGLMHLYGTDGDGVLAQLQQKHYQIRPLY